MPGPRGALAVRVDDGETDHHVTKHVSGLRFTKTAPGGHQSCSFTMNLPRDTFHDLGPQDRCYVYDARTAGPVWDGYTENPTPRDGPGGQSFEISAVGGMALASDETRSLVYVDQNLDAWAKDPYALEAGQVEAGVWAGDGISRRLRTSIPGGGVVATNAFSGAANYLLSEIGMNFGAITCFVQSGKISTDYRASLVHPGGTIDFDAATITTVGAGFFLYCGTDFPSPTTLVSLRLRRTGGATNVADDTTWTDFVNLIVVGQRVDRHGTLLTGSAGLVSATEVLASQVVEDLLGRLLTFCDPALAQVDTSSFGITQLSYPAGTKAAGVLNGLDVFEPDFLWEIGETLPNGSHRFAYRAWPTTPRYEVSARDGWVQTGSDVDLCNRIHVSWTDAAGKQRVTEVTAADLGLVGIGLPVDALGSRVKDADPVTLPAGFGSEANALRIGGQILTDKINPPKAGSVVVRRPIVDYLTGHKVMPWEIEPGYLVRVRETGDELRMTQMSYDDDAVAAALRLGRPMLTVEQRVARLDAA